MRRRLLPSVLLAGWTLALLRTAALAAPPTAAVHKTGAPPDLPRLFLSGPATFLALASCLAALFLCAACVRRAPALAAIGGRAAQRLEHGLALPGLWGVAAVFLICLLTVILFQIRILGLLGLLVFVAGLALVGLGLGVAALALGRALAAALPPSGPSDWEALRLGLACCLVASILPVVGWLLVLWLIAAGVGAVLETLLVGRPPEP